MWVGGVGARLAFAVAANNGAGPAIARFSVAHHITGEAAWIAALIMMALADVLTRLVIIYLRGRRLAASARRPPSPRSRVASVPDLVTRPATVHTVSMKARLAAAGLSHGATATWPGRRRRTRTCLGPGGASAIARPRARRRAAAGAAAAGPGFHRGRGDLHLPDSSGTGPARCRPGCDHRARRVCGSGATAISVRWARRGQAAQAAASILIGGSGVALAVLQPQGPVELAASLGVWFAAVRLPPVPAAVAPGRSRPRWPRRSA